MVERVGTAPRFCWLRRTKKPSSALRRCPPHRRCLRRRLVCSFSHAYEQTNIILGLGDPEYVAPDTNPLVAALTAGKALADLMNELATERRRKPKDDLTSQLLNAEIDGGTLTDRELASFFVLLVAAGNETTRNAISHGMQALSDHPDQMKTCG